MENPSSPPESIIFKHPPGRYVSIELGVQIIHVPGSRGVAVDESLARVWKTADGQMLATLAAALQRDIASVATEVSALRVAGLLLPPLLPQSTQPAASIPDPAPLVSVVVVTQEGRHHLAECLPSLMAQTYTRFEVIVVDAQSKDGTESLIREQFPSVRIIQQADGPNFAAGNNLGIQHASGDLILLLNNDTVLDPRCLEELVAAQAGRHSLGGVAAMLRFYDNRAFVNGLGTVIRSRRFGHDVAIGNLDVGQFDQIDQVPLLCFGAALIPRSAFDKVGLLDTAYEFYYEDADWSYRARALGLELIAAPRAKVYHKFGASVNSLPPAFKVRLSTRNRLRFALKNLPAISAALQLIGYVLDDCLRLIMYLSRRQGEFVGAILRAWNEFIHSVVPTMKARRQTWNNRARSQVDLATLAEPFPPPEMHGPYPRLTAAVIEQRYRPHLARLVSGAYPQRVLIISPDTVAVNMGGVGVRYWELARILARGADVTLAAPNRSSLKPDTFRLRTYTQGHEAKLRSLVADADIVVLSGFVMYHHPSLKAAQQYKVVDLYDPTVLENLERFSQRPIDEQRGLHQTGVAAYNELLAVGDFFVCASENQRDYWLGALTAAHRVNPDTYAADPTLRRLIDVVPFGLPDEPPRHTERVLKGVRPGMSENDKVIVWGGGLWDWLDPLTAIEAMPAVLDGVPEAKLFFMGTQHPNLDVPPSRMAQRAIERADQLGLRDRAIFFNDWVPYAARVNYLLEADVGISLHGDHIETRFSVRTRLMDYLWAGLPMVVTRGDTLSDLVAAKGLGHVVAPGCADEVARALVDLIRSPIGRERFEPVVRRFHWSKSAEPLARYAAAPWRNGGYPGDSPTKAIVTPIKHLPRKAVSVLLRRGPAGLLREIRSYLVWRWER